MKILLTGGVTGGHFYPIIAGAEALRDLVEERRILPPELYFMSTVPYNERLLFENDIKFMSVAAGKRRRYFSFLNFTDLFKTASGCLSALIRMYSLYPDIVFGKGGYASFPALFAARILHIPVIIHESDSHPGRVNLWAGKFARKIAVSYPEAAKYFGAKNQSKIAFTGNPIRPEVAKPLAKQHYAEHEGKPFFAGLVDYITSSPIIAAVFEGNNAIKATRQTMGATNPIEAATGSIRADFGLETGRNLTHGSDSPASARREIALFFGDMPPIAWKRDTDAWVFE